MQAACDTLEEEYNPTTYSRLVASFAQAGRLYENTSKVLNPIYLYYNFSDIETKYDIQHSWEYINFTIKELGNTMPEDLPTPEKSIKELEREGTLKIANK